MGFEVENMDDHFNKEQQELDEYLQFNKLGMFIMKNTLKF
jgi:hypothetical protein